VLLPDLSAKRKKEKKLEWRGMAEGYKWSIWVCV
jgi:hypothetical protein